VLAIPCIKNSKLVERLPGAQVFYPHSVRVRQEVFRLKMKGRLNYREGNR
jgi:hypothetical protein